jgi:GntR family transcriptional regulator
MDINIDHSSPVPLHAQVEELLRKLIELPQYKSGEFLPKEIDLARQLGVSRNTIRQATNKLENEGLITRKKGYGTKVKENTLTTKLDNWHSFTQEMNEKGIAFINYLIDAQWVEAGEKVTRFFHIPEHSKIVKLSRLRGDERGPFVYFESFFHPRLGITPDEDFKQPLYELLTNKYKTPVTTSREQITARSATKKTAQRLKIKKGDPILVRERFVLDPGNRAVEYNVGFYVADKFTYSIEIRR